MAGTKKRIRLDKLLVEKGLAGSRERARALIMAGRAMVNQVPVDKPGTLIPVDAPISLKGEDIPYVSRGGLKLEAIISAYDIDVTDRICMDVGASTGGFTDCLLQHGARKVYAVDVGYGQLAWKLRQDPRVIVIERTNIRNMPGDTIAEPVDLATVDVSFISLTIVVPAILKFLSPSGRIIALIKPQFEVGKGRVGKGGVVRDPELHHQVVTQFETFFSRVGFCYDPIIPSPILGPKGNQEFLIYARRVK